MEIYAEGSEIKKLYKVVSGTVRVCRMLPDGRRFIVLFALPGEIFGLDGVQQHRFSAEAVTEVVLIAFARKDLDAHMGREPVAAQSWQAFTLEKLAMTQDRLILLGCRSATERVAHFLLDLADRCRTRGNRLELPMSRYDIADHLELTAETVSRVFTILRKDGMIAIEDHHNLHLLDYDRLAEVADLTGVAA
ncbi:helix-turn-helix domain-containing protein [Roseomonas sp. 1311]|uniref:Helix-turn-helix domain-containing protein n=2 Tax=Roseomonas marmotae TaxID=2768161 RepID=A0ABS3KGL0_9PROT|nr:helix-turn-helix domain-containing protein [Roseomonas marmotae]